MNGSNAVSAAAGPAITPNTLNAISGVLNNTSTNGTNFSHHVTSPSNTAPTSQSDYIPSATSAASSHANGLFLLSQAHQELTKREEAAQARANNAAPTHTSTTTTNGTVAPASKRNPKRKSYEMSPPPPSAALSRAGGKRTRMNLKVRGVSEDMEDDDDDDDESNMDEVEKDSPLVSQPSTNRRNTRKPETEEEKRRNFLERNRQGMPLSCGNRIYR
jgi:ATF/CREB family transcription factor